MGGRTQPPFHLSYHPFSQWSAPAGEQRRHTLWLHGGVPALQANHQPLGANASRPLQGGAVVFQVSNLL